MNWHEYFTYEDGRLVWLRRGRRFFTTDRSWKAFNSRCAGKTTGSPDTSGHLQFCLWTNGTKRLYLVHRVIWEMHHGPIPEGIEIDHRNGVRADNRIENLRLATEQQNAWNAKRRSDNSSGVKGVHPHKSTGKWAAQIQHEKKKIHLGLFDSVEEAAAARMTAQAVYHGEYARTK